MSEENTISTMMAAYSQDAVDVAGQNFGVDLDYSTASLTLLEGILDRQHRSVPHGWRRLFRSSPSDEELQTFAKVWGAYLGEVMRRTWGGEWIIPEQGPFEGIICLRIGEETCSPPARVYKRLTQGEGDDILSYFAFFARDRNQTSGT